MWVSVLDCTHKTGAVGVEEVHWTNLSSKPRATRGERREMQNITAWAAERNRQHLNVVDGGNVSRDHKGMERERGHPTSQCGVVKTHTRWLHLQAHIHTYMSKEWCVSDVRDADKQYFDAMGGGKQ